VLALGGLLAELEHSTELVWSLALPAVRSFFSPCPFSSLCRFLQGVNLGSRSRALHIKRNRGDALRGVGVRPPVQEQRWRAGVWVVLR